MQLMKLSIILMYNEVAKQCSYYMYINENNLEVNLAEY